MEPPRLAKEPENWDAKPVKGLDAELFTIGALATALNRKPVTIRKWETNGWLPKARYMLRKGSSIQGQRRLYTREQIEGLVRIAREEHVLDDPKSLRTSIETTRFPERAKALWKELAR